MVATVSTGKCIQLSPPTLPPELTSTDKQVTRQTWHETPVVLQGIQLASLCLSPESGVAHWDAQREVSAAPGFSVPFHDFTERSLMMPNLFFVNLKTFWRSTSTICHASGLWMLLVLLC